MYLVVFRTGPLLSARANVKDTHNSTEGLHTSPAEIEMKSVMDGVGFNVKDSVWP